MKDQDGLAARIAAGLPVDEVPIRRVEQSAFIRLDVGI